MLKKEEPKKVNDDDNPKKIKIRVPVRNGGKPESSFVDIQLATTDELEKWQRRNIPNTSRYSAITQERWSNVQKEIENRGKTRKRESGESGGCSVQSVLEETMFDKNLHLRKRFGH